MGSKTGLGRKLKKDVGLTPEVAAATLVGGPVGGALVAKEQREAELEQGALKEAAGASVRAAESARAEEATRRAQAEESVRRQKQRARRQTIFAGQGVRENLFRRGISGQPQRATLLGG